jgi:hypothetical protein
MTPQEIFDTVATHLFTQGHKAINGHGGCVYRCRDGSKCAVGVLIPDDKYFPKMELGGVGVLIQIISEDIPSFFHSNSELLVAHCKIFMMRVIQYLISMCGPLLKT